MATTNQTGPFNYALKSTAIPANVQEFTASGTWTKPTGATFVMVELWGGGGAGGGGQLSSYGNYIPNGGGGGGGAYVFRTFKASELSSTVAVTVGAGGTPVSGSAGGGGGNSTFGTLVTAYAGGGGGQGTVSAVSFTSPPGGTGGGGLSNGGTNGVPYMGPASTATNDIHAHFGGNLTFGGASSGWGGGGGGGAQITTSPAGTTQVNGGCSIMAGAGGGPGVGYNGTVNHTGFGNYGGTVGSTTTNGGLPGSVYAGCNGRAGGTAGAGGNGGGVPMRQSTGAGGVGIAAGGTRIVTGSTSVANTTYASTDSGVTILNAQKAYDSGTTGVIAPFYAITYSSTTSLFYGYYPNSGAPPSGYKKVWSSSDGLTWTLLYDFSTLVANSSIYSMYYFLEQGGRHFANFTDGSLYVSTDSTGSDYTPVGISALGFTAGQTYVAYDATRSLWVLVYNGSGTTIYTTTDFSTFTAVANLPATGARTGVVVTSAGRWIVSTGGTNNIRYTDDAGATAWVTPTTGLPATSGTPLLQIVNGLIVWSNGGAGFTVIYSSADNGVTWVAVTAPATRTSPDVVWNGTNYAVVLNGQTTASWIATSPDLTSTSVWTTRSVTFPVLTAGGNGGAGAAPGGGGGGGGASFSGTVGGVAISTSSGGAGARGLVRVYSW